MCRIRNFRAVLFGAAATTSLMAAAGSACAAAPAPAPAPAAGPTQIGEVLVTVRRRSEVLQKTPATVTAFTAQAIEDKGIEAPRDFIQAVPNVTLVETQNAGTSFVVIRGISQARNSEPSVAVVVDGVPQTQPAQFNQELVDIQQIEVLKGPQGALYGRNAIGGAILLTTKQPTEHWEGRVTGGWESGPGGKAQGVVSGPLNDVLGVRAAASYTNTSGHIENSFLHQKADPVTDFNGRLTFLFKPNDKFKADLRLQADRLWTQALYFNIVYYPFLSTLPFPPFNVAAQPDVNNTSLPVRVNNPGKNNRAIYDIALKMDYDTDIGTLTSISGYNLTKEILTGDAWDFLPPAQSAMNAFTGFDQTQSQFLRVRTLTQEIRITSPSEKRFRWIAGAQIFATDRFISTGTEWDTGHGVTPTFYSPTSDVTSPFTTPNFATLINPQATFLADKQNNLAWAGYLDTSFDITSQLEVSANIRFDHDHRKDTPLEAAQFLPLGISTPPGGFTEHSWKGWQPQFVLKYTPLDNVTLYGSYSRGFRSGGFNQYGVQAVAAANGFAGVGSQFNAERAETFEAGFKTRLFDRRLTLNAAAYTTKSTNGYFFVYLSQNSTQNLGNIPEVRLTGFDLDGTFRVTDDIQLNAGYGFTDSSVKKYYHDTFPQYDFRVGEQAPLVSRYTLNVGAQWRPRINDMLHGILRVDYDRIGKTFFWESDPAAAFAGAPPVLERKPVDLVDLRTGVQASDWSIILWAKNLNNAKYNSEYSPGGFVFKAEPRRWGVDLTKKF